MSFSETAQGVFIFLIRRLALVTHSRCFISSRDSCDRSACFSQQVHSSAAPDSMGPPWPGLVVIPVITSPVTSRRQVRRWRNTRTVPRPPDGRWTCPATAVTTMPAPSLPYAPRTSGPPGEIARSPTTGRRGGGGADRRLSPPAALGLAKRSKPVPD